jgi:VWFA-related protein
MILKPAALFAAIVALTFAGAAFAADPVNIEIMAVEEEPGSMVLTVSAVDENGQPFPGLDPSSFNVWINDQALIVKELHNETDRQPASVLLLVDVSTSMAGEPIQQAQVAINEFIDLLEPDDEVAVMVFSGGVNLVQDFTSDRNALDAAVGNLALTDGTALYDGVTQAAAKMAGVDRSRKMIVLLSDGLENVNQGARDASIQAAKDAGVSFIALGLGAETDLDYLQALTGISGGSLIQAATPAELRAAYTNLAFAIRSQYTLVTEVPRSIDRTVAGTLKIHVIHRADNAFAERTLNPLEGAVPPPFTMTLDGIAPGDKHNGLVDLLPTVEAGIEVVKVDYILDDAVVHTTEGVGSYTLDASQLANGSHVLKVVATDSQGREGEVQVPFLVPVLAAPSEGSSLPIIPILIAVLLIGVGYIVFKFGRKRWIEINTPTYSRIDTWATKRTPSTGSGDDDSEPEIVSPAQPATPLEGAVQGRVVVMDEAAVRGGELEAILEYEMKSLPLTFGSGPDVDIRVDDAGGLIAAEEARIWIQRGRMVYHKLTTLSAMATEGVTAGWQFLDDGDEMRVGPYRLIFQKHQEEKTEADLEPTPQRLPQEHGMALHQSFGLTEAGRSVGSLDNHDEPGPFAIDLGDGAADAAGEDVTQDADEDPVASDSDWGWGSATAESSAGMGSAQTSALGWDTLEPAQEAGSAEPSLEESQPSEWSLEGDPGAPAESPSVDPDERQPEEWGPSLLEPRSADWLVEQSQPVGDGVGQIIQPDAWGGFVSSDDDESPAAPSDEEVIDDEDDRAWGT